MRTRIWSDISPTVVASGRRPSSVRTWTYLCRVRLAPSGVPCAANGIAGTLGGHHGSGHAPVPTPFLYPNLETVVESARDSWDDSFHSPLLNPFPYPVLATRIAEFQSVGGHLDGEDDAPFHAACLDPEHQEVVESARDSRGDSCRRALSKLSAALKSDGVAVTVTLHYRFEHFLSPYAFRFLAWRRVVT